MTKNGLGPDDPVLGLDIATKTGWSVICGNRNIAGRVEFPGSLGERLALFRCFLVDLVEEHKPAAIGIEAPFISNHNAAMILLKYHGVAEERLSTFKGLVHPVHHSTWKSHIMKSGFVSTSAKGKGLVVNAIRSMGFVADNADEADATAIAVYLRDLIMSQDG